MKNVIIDGIEYQLVPVKKEPKEKKIITLYVEYVLEAKEFSKEELSGLTIQDILDLNTGWRVPTLEEAKYIASRRNLFPNSKDIVYKVDDSYMNINLDTLNITALINHANLILVRTNPY